MMWFVGRGVDAVDAWRRAWLSAMDAHLRAGRRHEEAARVQVRCGRPDLAAVAVARAARQRELFDVALAQHPEWVDEVPAWPKRAELTRG